MSNKTTKKNFKQIIASTLAALVLLSGCSMQNANLADKTPANPQQRNEKAPTPELQLYYDQKIVWQSCEENQAVTEITNGETNTVTYSCAQITVPLDYANPTGKTITLQAVRHSNDGEIKTPLLFNPGGPGGSAVSGLPNMVGSIFTNKVQQKYDLVAVDPRGVGVSSPAKCLSNKEIDNLRAGNDLQGNPLPEDDSNYEKVLTEAAAYAQKCLDNAPGIAEHMDTNSVVADFDIVRAALGQEKISFFGFSYGTYIGALYADTFPANVGVMVLDGAVDPSLNVEQIASAQANGFEASIKHFLEVSATADPDFPFQGKDAGTQLLKWWKNIDKTPLKTTDPARPLTGSLARAAVFGGLYSEEYYQFVAEAMKKAVTTSNGTELLNLADLLNERRADGTYEDNSFDAFNLVNNLDYIANGGLAEWKKHAETVKAANPLVGDQFGAPSATLAGWKITPKNTKRKVTGAGAAPILIVGTTHDPATPYQWSVDLAKQLKSARLITQEGWSHGAYGQNANDCLRNAIDNYLIEGTLPEENLQCKEN